MTDTGLQPFLMAMLVAPDHALEQALRKPEGLAVKHGLPVAWVVFYVANWLNRSR